LKIISRITSFIFIIILSSALIGQPGRDSWQQPERIMDSIGVKQGMTIGEIGAGRGYFTFKLASRVGEHGRIFANDIDKDVLKKIEEKCKEQNVLNISTIVGEIDHPQFADSSIDMAVMMIAFHDFKEPEKMMNNLKSALRPGAKVYIIERDPDKWSFGRGHFWPENKVVAQITKAKYIVTKIMRFLPRDNIYECIPGDPHE
jgi:ubiquinone/menaquinone biosynthesis C-methylase UbiE